MEGTSLELVLHNSAPADRKQEGKLMKNETLPTNLKTDKGESKIESNEVKNNSRYHPRFSLSENNDDYKSIDYASSDPVRKVQWTAKKIEQLQKSDIWRNVFLDEDTGGELGCKESPKASIVPYVNDNGHRPTWGEMEYVENTSTGSFQRRLIGSRQAHDKSRTNNGGAEKDEMLKRLVQKIAGILIFLQGLFSGLCMYTLYDSSVNKGVAVKWQNGDNEIGVQRMYLIFNVLCLAGNVAKFPLLQKQTRGDSRFGIGICIVLLYFVSMVLSLSIARHGIILRHQFQDGMPNEVLMKRIQECDATSISRSVICIVAWLIGTFTAA